MTEDKRVRTLEEEVLLLQQAGKERPLLVEEVLHLLSGKGRPLILILLSLPFCQPIQIPGFSAPFGLAIAFIGLRMDFGKKIWLPKRLLEKVIPSHTIEQITDMTLNVIRRLKPWVHPRIMWICRSTWMQKVNGLMIVILGIFLALPLPIPLSNLTAGWSILLLSLGILEDDGLFVLIGYLISFITISLLILMFLTAKSLFYAPS